MKHQCVTLLLACACTAPLVHAMQQAIPDEEKVTRSDCIAVAKVITVTTSRVFRVWVDESAPLVMQKEELSNDPSERDGKTPDWGELICRCSVLELIKGDVATTNITVTYEYPLVEPNMVPWPTELVKDKTYIMWLTATNGMFTPIHTHQGAREVRAKYYERLRIEYGKWLENQITHEDYLARIRALVVKKKDTTVRGFQRPLAGTESLVLD